MKLKQYLDEANEPVNFEHHFKRFGGFKGFLKATGLKEPDVRMMISNGTVPEAARKKIRAAVAKHIIKHGAKV
jgi:hypothetical protein